MHQELEIVIKSVLCTCSFQEKGRKKGMKEGREREGERVRRTIRAGGAERLRLDIIVMRFPCGRKALGYRRRGGIGIIQGYDCSGICRGRPTA